MDDVLCEILQNSTFDDCQHTALLTRHSNRVVTRRVERLFTQVRRVRAGTATSPNH